ncbi:uncharacterized mitochondrial protein-like protein [Tanacetum coccineum]|uniref:Uncharacterized mitochondrial protein-like protein n=1 Tax=Tanacetum coccineum TaxID=301880 RepID=A0ABQ5DMU2_9ASTR
MVLVECSRHMTWNMSYLSDFKEFDEGYVTFGGGAKGGKITSKFDGKSDEGFFVGYSMNSKAFRVYNIRTRKVEENLHIRFLEDKPIIAGTEESIGAGHSSKETGSSQDYILMPLWKDGDNVTLEATHADGDETEVDMSNITTTYPVPSTPNTRIHKDHSLDHIFARGYNTLVDTREILKKFGFSTVRIASTPIETSKPLLKDAEAKDVDVHLYRSMIGSLMINSFLGPDIMFDDSPFDLEAYSDSDYAGASLDRKSTTRGCQFLRSRLISWQCKKQTIVANSTTEVEYVCIARLSAMDRHDLMLMGKKLVLLGKNLMLLDQIKILPRDTTAEGIGLGGSPRRQDTIGDRPAQTRFERLSKQSNEPPLSIVNTLGSGEDSMKLQELMDLCTKLSDRVLDLENVKDAQALEINKIESSAKKSLGDQEDSSKQGRNEVDQDEGISWFQEDSKTQGRYGYDIGVNTSSTSITTASINITTAEPVTTACAPITIAGVFVSTAEPSTPPTTTTTTTPIEDEDLTIAQTFMKMKSEKSKAKGVTMQEPSESGTRVRVPPLQIDLKDKGKANMVEPEKPKKKKDKIEYDSDVAQRLQEELDEEARLEREREEEASKAANITEWDDVQAMMDADYELATKLQEQERRVDH